MIHNLEHPAFYIENNVSKTAYVDDVTYLWQFLKFYLETLRDDDTAENITQPVDFA